MTKLLTAVLVFVVLAPGMTGSADASNENAKLAIHLGPAGGNGCVLAAAPPPCYSIISSGTPGSYYAYVLVTNGDASAGIAGLQFGISYGNLRVWAWHLCATLEFNQPTPVWPSSGSGNLITWDTLNNCQRTQPGGAESGVVAVAGYFYLTAYSSATLALTPRPIDGITAVADCSARQVTLPSSALGYARFSASGTEPGYNPCAGGVPTSQCGVTGPASVQTMATDIVYTAATDLQAPSYTWAVMGSAAIVGSNTGQSVHVNAGPPGTFQISVAAQGLDGSTNCGTSVDVLSDFQCSIPCGPDNVPGRQLATYTAPPGYGYAWSITNGSIIGSATESSVQVRVGDPYLSTVSVTLTYNGISAYHSKAVQVGPVPADPPDSQKDAKICLHVQPRTSKNLCGSTLPACNAVVTNGELYPTTYNVFVIVSNGYTNGLANSGVAGLQFGIDYDGAPQSGVDIYSWYLCASMEFPMPNWPGDDSGTLITWDPVNQCQNHEPGGSGTGVTATAGFFYLAAYTPDVLRITPRPIDDMAAKVANCNSAESILVDATHNPSPSPLGAAGFGMPGYNPCNTTIPVQPTTWSNIKTLMAR